MIDPASFKTTPFAHQSAELLSSAELRSWALFWEQGTGKTKYAIDVTAHAHRNAKIRAMVIVAPSGVEANWITDEIPAHMPSDVPWRGHVWSTKRAGNRSHKAAIDDLLKCDRQLPVLAMSYDAWLTKAGKQAAWDLMRSRPSFLHFDESQHLKTFGSERTKSITKAAPYATMSRIYSGTPIDGSPMDIYSQINIVAPNFWRQEIGSSLYTDFKNFFGVFAQIERRDGKFFPQLVNYQNLTVLRDLLKKISSRVLKADVLDLPPKLYTKRYYEMSPPQQRMYDLLDSEYAAMFDDNDPDSWITAEMAIVRMTRLQQVLCGYVPVDGEDEPRELIDPAHNPRADATVEFVSEAGNLQTMVWAQYRLDIDILMERLRAEGRKPVRYDGKVDADERLRARLAFAAGDASDFVGNTSVGAEGLTFVNCRTVAFHNNNYRMIKRKQAEDRVHRIGQLWPVLYGDMICRGTRDERAIQILQTKHRNSETILGDVKKEWL